MARITWNTIGERLFEAGVDQGVLYVKGEPGVPWNGLIAVSESPVGGEVTPYYVDGIRYLNHVALEEFAANIEAYTYPEVFAQCDGTAHVGNGLFVTHQAKKSFGLSYRTKVGNDVDGVDHAYKIHLVYNATASPTTRQNNTIGDTVDPFNFSWAIATKPPLFKTHSPTAHFVIDSRETPIGLMTQIQDILYGTEDSPPRLPSVDELFHVFETYETNVFDAGYLVEVYFNTFDAGHISEEQTSTVDGGSP